MGNLVKLEADLGAGDPPDLRKGIISIFADLPASSVAAKRAEVQAYIDLHGGRPGGFDAVMFGVIVLHTWGSQQTATEYEWDTTSTITIDTFPGGTTDVRLAQITGSHSAETPPSFIGVYVGGASSTTLDLVVNIQTRSFASCLNTTNTVDGAHWDNPGFFDGNVVLEYGDASYVDAAKPEYFGNSGVQPNDGNGSEAKFSRPEITAGTEVKFHVLVSWDIAAGCAVHGVDPDEDEIGTSAGTDTASKIWCSIDGVNKNGYDLPAMWAHFDTGIGDPNEMLSFIAASFSGHYGSAFGTPVVTLDTSATSVPFFPVAIPSEASLMREGAPFVPNYLVRVGRIQFFAGVSIDTSIEENVTAFRLASGEPAPLSAARTLLSPSVPIVEFATATAMINGTNSGSVGNLTPDGTIAAFTG